MIEKQLSYKFKVYEKIKEDIITGVIPQGEILNERKLSEELGISRTPIREALQLLNRDGWLIIETYKGAVVRTFDMDYVEKVLKVRGSLEILAVVDATNNATKADLEYMNGILDKQEKSFIDYNPTDFMILDRQFHEKIYALSKNEILISLLGNLNDIIRFFGIKALRQPERNKSTLKEHRDILNSMGNRDIEVAKKNMEYHMQQTSANIYKYNAKFYNSKTGKMK